MGEYFSGNKIYMNGRTCLGKWLNQETEKIKFKNLLK